MNLEDYSLSELRELAKNKNIKGYYSNIKGFFWYGNDRKTS